MKKIISVIACTMLILLCVCGFIGCANGTVNNAPNSPNTDNNSFVVPTTHTEHISNLADFEKFFTYSNVATQSTVKENYYSKGSPAQTFCTLTINITPRITGFVEYSGNISFKIVANKDSTSKGHNNEIITTTLFYTGNTVIKKEYQSNIYRDDNVLLPHKGELVPVGTYSSYDNFQNTYSLEINSVDIVVTYHNEGLSGDYSQTYTTVNVTKYNYSSYLFGKLKNSAYYVSVRYDTGETVELTINGYVPENKKIDGIIIDVTGTIDIYPSAFM